MGRLSVKLAKRGVEGEAQAPTVSATRPLLSLPLLMLHGGGGLTVAAAGFLKAEVHMNEARRHVGTARGWIDGGGTCRSFCGAR